MLGIKTVLHPTDFSERSNLAFWYAASLARDYNAKLVLLHVAEPAIAGYGDGMLIPTLPVDTESLRQRLREFRFADPRVTVEHRLIEGDPATEIVGMADLLKCDVIVMGTHGRTGLSRLLMGSVAEHVLRHSPCPVVTIRSGMTMTTSGQGPTAEKVPQPVTAGKA